MATNSETVAPAAENSIEKSVEAITEAIETTTISPKAENTEADDKHAISAAEGRRLYIGNLSYQTTDEQLREFFSGFSIESTSIPTNPRTGRAVGYAFVDLTTKEEADRAISELGGKDILDRKVSVQLARKPGSNENGTKKSGDEGADGDAEQTQHQPKRGRNGRARGKGRGGRSGPKDRTAAREQSREAEGTTPQVPGQVLPLVEATDVKTETGDGDAPTDSKNEASPTRGPFKPKKKRGPPENGVPSATKIMVANLPYELTEEKLKELFAAYEPESAKIALRPIPRYMVRKLQARGEPRKGRGFGFVNLASEEMQKKAVEEMNGKLVEGREIAVKVAIDSQVSDNEDKENSGEDAGKAGSDGENAKTVDEETTAA